jgi:hypothetical protein
LLHIESDVIDEDMQVWCDLLPVTIDDHLVLSLHVAIAIHCVCACTIRLMSSWDCFHMAQIS